MDGSSFEGFRNRRVLVTGGGGFIGSHLVARLIKGGADVSITSRVADPWRLKDIEGKIKILNLDVTDEGGVRACLEEMKPEYIFHLAAYGIDSKDRDYLKAANTNIIGTINLLNAAADVGCGRFVNVGSCAEYGDRKEIMREDLCLQPVTIYGSTKASSTIIAHQIAGEKGIGIVTLRPFGIFGEGEDRHKIFSHVIMTILEGRDVELTLCEQMRDYCHVENIVDGLILAALKKDIKNEIFNIGVGELHPLKYYIEMIFKEMKTTRKPLYGALPHRQREMWAPQPDISKIRSMLGWEPRIGLEEGIMRTVNWYKANYKLAP